MHIDICSTTVVTCHKSLVNITLKIAYISFLNAWWLIKHSTAEASPSALNPLMYFPKLYTTVNSRPVTIASHTHPGLPDDDNGGDAAQLFRTGYKTGEGILGRNRYTGEWLQVHSAKDTLPRKKHSYGHEVRTSSVA